MKTSRRPPMATAEIAARFGKLSDFAIEMARKQARHDSVLAARLRRYGIEPGRDRLEG